MHMHMSTRRYTMLTRTYMTSITSMSTTSPGMNRNPMTIPTRIGRCAISIRISPTFIIGIGTERRIGKQ